MTPSREIERLLEIMAALRDKKNGCPWDLEQTFETIAPYTVEEAYEVADAIERGDTDDLRLELGDLLLQSVYHAQIAQEAGLFDFGDVVEGISAKMIRRHPHVFGTEDATAKEYSAKGLEAGTWERIKAEEKEEAAARRAELGLPDKRENMSILDDVPSSFPALTSALKLQKKAAKVGFDWNDPQLVLDKVEEEINEVRAELNTGNTRQIEEELGDLLFALANLARHAKVDPEQALRNANVKFRRRFKFIEENIETVASDLQSATLGQMDKLWNAAKLQEKQTSDD